ncbi:N-acetylmuramoyl-L-alanine amidase [Vibrio palustris]|uniref:N-acetylmuramoyl-L-alanine amidase n=1 Tax=Vibrio palustris TaxID=1918946 RepID=A0A1R4B8L2_9VIBR|nr:N-acetylmuramoyl-L-alanine amidase AmiB precursor [Vibrio palustris]
MIAVRSRSFCIFIGVLIALFSHSLFANTLESLRVWPSPDDTRVVIDVKSKVTFSYFRLSSPERLVVDLHDTKRKANLPMSITDSQILKKIRASGPPEKSTSRLVFELKKRVSPKVFTLPPTPGGQYGHRLVIDLPNSDKPKKAASHNPLSKMKSAPEKKKKATPKNQDIVIAVDPGHGGEDPGSIGPGRRFEKNVTLSVGKKLADLIDRVPGMHSVMTRKGDYYVSLNRRTEIAREHGAYLLVSIHADAFRSPKPRGASVFVLNTRRANTEISRWVENHEEQSELLGGAGAVLAKKNSDRNVSQTLLDLQFSHSQKEGYKLASDILGNLGKVAHLHRSKPVNASLAVLKSPDIPSVLVETGFISNPAEEKLLFQQSHQEKIARAIATAIVEYFKENPPQGTMFANHRKPRHYKVKSGDSLSVIAHRYGVSVANIKKANDMSSSVLSVGQNLTIPGGRASISVPKVSHQVETETISHKVARGEYLGKIAAHYKVSVADIKRENHLKSNVLSLGQTLKITVSLKDKPLRKHKVSRGEYLGKLATKYGVSINSIRNANHLKSDSLAVGQVLIIPNK